MGRLSDAMGKVNYKGHWGGTVGDFGTAIDSLVTQVKADKEKKADAAYKAATLKVQQDKALADIESSSADRAFKEKDLAFRSTEADLDNKRASSEFAQRMSQQEEDRKLREQNQAALDEDRDARLAVTEELGRGNASRAERRIIMQNERGTLTQNEFGQLIMFKPGQHEGVLMEMTPDGKLVPKGGVENSFKTPQGREAGAPGSQPLNKKPIQAPGPVAVDTPTVQSPADTNVIARGKGAVPVESERQANLLVANIEPSIANVEKMYGEGGEVGVPNPIQQGLAEAAKGGGFIGGLANQAISGDTTSFVGKLGTNLGLDNPEYQAALVDLTKIYRAYVYITTGKQLNEAEAADNARQYVIMAGDPPELRQKKVADIKNFAAVARQGASRARDWLARYDQQVGGGNGNPTVTPPTGGKKWKLPGGQVIDLE